MVNVGTAQAQADTPRPNANEPNAWQQAELGFFSVLLDLAGRAEIILEECLQLFVFFGHGFHLRVAASK